MEGTKKSTSAVLNHHQVWLFTMGCFLTSFLFIELFLSGLVAFKYFGLESFRYRNDAISIFDDLVIAVGFIVIGMMALASVVGDRQWFIYNSFRKSLFWKFFTLNLSTIILGIGISQLIKFIDLYHPLLHLNRIPFIFVANALGFFGIGLFGFLTRNRPKWTLEKFLVVGLITFVGSSFAIAYLISNFWFSSTTTFNFIALGLGGILSYEMVFVIIYQLQTNKRFHLVDNKTPKGVFLNMTIVLGALMANQLVWFGYGLLCWFGPRKIKRKSAPKSECLVKI